MAQRKASPSRYTTTPSGPPYDVFLSFRGTDTRKNFTDHLYTALRNARFVTFRDDQLKRGENIWEELKKAIQLSRSSVIVFSRDYTFSDSCLDELVVILERKKTSDHVVFPVFFNVSPSKLGEEGESLSKIHKCHENQSPKRLKGWREALMEVVDLAGFVLEDVADGHEAEFIKVIVRGIHAKLGGVPLSDVQKELKEKLSDVDRVLNDAERKQLKFRKTVKPWLLRLKEAVYDAGDLLQEIKTEALRQNIEHKYGNSTSKVQELISTPSHAFDPSLIYPSVESVLNRLDSFMEPRSDALVVEASAGYSVSQKLESSSLVADSGVYGRDDEKEMLIQLLLTDESGNKMSVIPIVGLAGIGKTTLAQLLYDDDRVKQHFDIKAWACVSQKFDVLRISQQIYESLAFTACNGVSLELVHSKLKAALKGKKIFLVLDDVWTTNCIEWEYLQRPFQFGAHGSKIIVTTRNQGVAYMVGTLETHNLMPMPEKYGWPLFKKYAFKNAGVVEHTDFGKIGRQIVRKCKGHPLAIKSVASLLCSKSDVGEWETISNSDLWELPLESDVDILPSLWLSYMDLSLQLKHCFAHCAIIPKNYEFSTSELVYLWKAEDLLQPNNLKTAEEIGQEYFNVLISISFFQVSSRSNQYIMHDLINDLASFVSGELCFRWQGGDSPYNLSKTRHFSYMPEYQHEADSEMFTALQQAKCLHTFLPLVPSYLWRKLWGKVPYEALLKFQCLRLLKLPCSNMKELPDSIKNLKHLKHLDLSHSSIEKLPDTICTLYNLQVLLLSNCGGLTELPANLGRLINLSDLDNKGTNLKKMPPCMGNLTDLQMLPEFILDKHTGVDNLPELEKLQNLRGTLCISGLVHSSHLEAYILRDKKFLEELVLDWRRRDSRVEGNYTVEEIEVLEKLQPHLKLKRLTIKGYGGKMFPCWSEYYSSSALVYLKLVNCENCMSLPPLEQLQSLRELYIDGLHGVVSIGSEFYYGDGEPFKSLRSLTLYDMSGWKEWRGVRVFPNLGQLEISRCPNLTGRLALDGLPLLETLSVLNCPKLECFLGDGFPSKLKSLEVRDCKKLNAKSMQNLNKGLRTLTSLERLLLDFDCDENVDWFAVEEGMFPSTLTYLQIYRLNCETIDGAKWFRHLNSLRELIIYNCPALRCLPDSGLPTSLSHLTIHDCPLLEKRCQRETGEDWPKIADIKHIDINFITICA